MLAKVLAEYLKLFPTEQPDLSLLLQQVNDNEKLNDRRNFHGHITGSAIVVTPDKTEILFIHHKLFDRWQQPGGHWESDDEASPLVAAQREAEEETGVLIAEYRALDANNPVVPLDIDSHQVPARPAKDEPIHWHHDFRYVFVATTKQLSAQMSEVNDARWFPINAPETAVIARPMIKLSLL